MTFEKAYCEELASMHAVQMPTIRTIQDYRSTYNDIRDWLYREKKGAENTESRIDWGDVVLK